MEKRTITELMEWLGDIKRDSEKYIIMDDNLNKLRFNQQEQLTDTLTIYQNEDTKEIYINSLSTLIYLNDWDNLDDSEQLLLSYLNFDKQTFIKTFKISDLIYFFSRFEEISELINNDKK